MWVDNDVPNIIYPHMKCRWNRTMLKLCGIVTAILKMATGRNFSMSGINSGHHNLSTHEMFFKIFEISAILKMTAKIRHKKWVVKIQHCPISSKLYMWVDNDVPNWYPTLKNFYRSPFMKCRWNRTMLNLFRIVVAILKMATGRNFRL
jgi:hypothetical protein